LPRFRPAAAPVAAGPTSFPVWAIVALAGVLILSGVGGFLYTRICR